LGQFSIGRGGQFSISADRTGDLIVTLPPDFIAKMGLETGDELDMEVVDGAIVLTRKSPAPPR
ncbi:MAG: AbrB/MazE/SpoVT family DNA-binding domain-containing protein, partial [Pseudomonas sp.]